MTNRTRSALALARTLDAAVDPVFTMLTSRDEIAKWFGPSDDFDITIHEWNCEIGGTYRVQFDAPENETYICRGEFRELVPARKVAYTWSWEGQPAMDTLVSYSLAPEGGKTALTMTHEGFPTEDVRDHHEKGWGATLERLARAVA